MAMDEVRGDGGAALLTAPTLAELKAEVDQIRTDFGELVKGRVDYEDTRLCRWVGQAPDGLKHAAYNRDEPVEPFEGASDMRVRAADMVISEQVMLLVIAAARAQINFRATEATDREAAGAATLVMRWLLSNHLGAVWIRELLKLANYYLADSPALGLMKTWWRRETALRMQRLTVDELMGLYLDRVREVSAEATAGGRGLEAGEAFEGQTQEGIEAQAQQAAADFVAMLGDPELGEEALAALLLQFFPDVRPGRARKVIRELRTAGRAEFPVPYIRYDGPAVAARQFGVDWWVPANTSEFQDARVFFEVEWLTKTQVIERQISEGWSAAFVEGLVGTVGRDGRRVGGLEGVAVFPDCTRNEQGSVVQTPATAYRGLYQVVTAYYLACNEDGVPGRFYVTFHPGLEVAATERKLLDYAHGGYPGHVFQREVLNGRMVDSRGLGELAGGYQGLLKLYCDSFGNHAALAGVPPIITRGRQRLGTLHIKPLAELPAKRDGDYAWLNPPQYPATVINMVAELRRQMDEYFGRRNEQVPAELVRLHEEFRVMWWLLNLRVVLGQLWALIQQYATDEWLARITNTQGLPVARSVEEIQGQFDVDLQFNPQDLDPEYLKSMAEIVKDMLMAMDRDKTIDPAPVVATLLWRLSPDLAGAALRNVAQANQDEVQDEIRKYQEIRAGTEPELPDDGSLNYTLRLQLYQNMAQMNPAIYEDMAEDKRKILESRLQRLQVLAQQFGENVQIGRQGGRAALPAGE